MTKIKQETQTMEARYRRAQTLLQGFWTRNITPNSTVFPIWIEGSDCFWYQRRSQQGKEYRLVNTSTSSNSTAFDHQAQSGQRRKGRHQGKPNPACEPWQMDPD